MKLLHMSINFQVRTTPIRKRSDRMQCPGCLSADHYRDLFLYQKINWIFYFHYGNTALVLLREVKGKRIPIPEMWKKNNFPESHLFY